MCAGNSVQGDGTAVADILRLGDREGSQQQAGWLHGLEQEGGVWMSCGLGRATAKRVKHQVA